MKAVLPAVTIFSLLLFGAQSLWAQTSDLTQTNSHIWVVPQVVREIQKIKQQQFVAFNPHYLEERSNFIAQFRVVGKQLFAKEAAGENVRCAPFIFKELWRLISSSADLKHMNERLDVLENNLIAGSINSAAKITGPECLTEPWEKLDWT